MIGVLTTVLVPVLFGFILVIGLIGNVLVIAVVSLLRSVCKSGNLLYRLLTHLAWVYHHGGLGVREGEGGGREVTGEMGSGGELLATKERVMGSDIK